MTTVLLRQGSAQTLWALSVFASTDETRPELHGIGIERLPDLGRGQRFSVCASNGHILGANIVHGTCRGFKVGEVRVLPFTQTYHRKPGTETVIAAAHMATDGFPVDEELRLGWNEMWFTIEHDGFTVKVRTAKGEFPVWQGLIPITTAAPKRHRVALSAPYAGVWSTYAARAGTKMEPHTTLMFRFNGSLKAVTVLNPLDPGFVGIWMPMREDLIDNAKMPDWLNMTPMEAETGEEETGEKTNDKAQGPGPTA